MLLHPRLTIYLFGKSIHAFHFFGVLGYIAGSLLGVFICYYTGLLIPVILLMSATGAATFFLLAMGAKVITGKERIVYYHHEIAILLCCSLVLKFIDKPVLSYLDITLLGIATFLAFGRIGCFSVGCCHGRPATKGVVYGPDHVEKGFPYYYEGLPLTPVQLIESLFVFLVILAGTMVLRLGLPAGTFLLVYTVFYGAFRFGIEFFRGDPDRPYWLGLSEAQWTTLLLVLLTVAGAATGVLPFYVWHIPIAIALTGISLFIVLTTNKSTRRILPAEIRQIALTLRKLKQRQNRRESSIDTDQAIPVYTTKQGWSFSAGTIVQDGRQINHYTFSCKQDSVTDHINPRMLARLIKQLQRHNGAFEIRDNGKGVVHILFSDE